MPEVRSSRYFAVAVRRDAAWAELSKARYWRRYKLAHGPAAGIRIADELRRQVIAQHPGWPGPRERALDHAAHERVLDALQGSTSRRR